MTLNPLRAVPVANRAKTEVTIGLSSNGGASFLFIASVDITINYKPNLARKVFPKLKMFYYKQETELNYKPCCYKLELIYFPFAAPARKTLISLSFP